MPGQIPSRSDILYQRFTNLLAILNDLLKTFKGRVELVVDSMIAQNRLLLPHNNTYDKQGIGPDYFHLSAEEYQNLIANGGGSGGGGINAAIGGRAIVLFLASTDAGVASADTLEFTSNTSTEVLLTQAPYADSGPLLLKSFITPDPINNIIIPAGGWGFNFYVNVDTVGRNCVIKTEVYKRSSTGTTTLLFSETSPAAITKEDNPYLLTNYVSLQGDFPCALTDKLLVKVYADSSTALGAVVTLVEGGNTYPSSIVTPLAFSHNTETGIQGGSDAERYHLTLDQYNDVLDIPNNRKYLGRFLTLTDLETAFPTATYGCYAIVDLGAGNNAGQYIWDNQEGWLLSSSYAMGPTGATGATGAPGIDGANGADGANGIDGANGAGYYATSSTSLLVSIANKTFNTQTGLAYSAGARARATSVASPTTYMEGIVSSYAGNSLILAVDRISGSGTLNNWNINLVGDVGATGATGADGAGGIAILDHGTINTTGTLTLDVAAANCHIVTFGGTPTITLAFSSWPAGAFKGYVELVTNNAGIVTFIFPTINWQLVDDTYTTSFSTYLANRGGETALKTSGVDRFLFWSEDNGTTLYGVLK